MIQTRALEMFLSCAKVKNSSFVPQVTHQDTVLTMIKDESVLIN